MNVDATSFRKPHAAPGGLAKQHLIDPEICIRCNTCEETCPSSAIVHNDDNYAVLSDVCNDCGKCLDPCPTGAIRSWRDVAEAYSVDEQLGWSELPVQKVWVAREEPLAQPQAALPDALAAVEQGLGPCAPLSAARPSVNLFKRNQPAIATIAANVRVTATGSDIEVRHVVLRFADGVFPVLEGQSVGIALPGTDAKGKRHAIRQYSVASARHGEAGDRNAIALTVKRVPGGLCSNHLCDLPEGASIEVTGPFGATFLMPDDPAANLLMVGTGTGVAPFRGFIERRREAMPQASGQVDLFFGAQTPQAMPYEDYLRDLPSSLAKRELCYSRMQGQPRAYVQDRIRASVARVSTLLRDTRTHLYLCGLKGMEKGVEDALADVCSAAGLDWEELKAVMRKVGRYHVETY